MGLDGVQVGWGEFICVARVLKKIYGKCLCFENRRQKLTSVGLAFLTDYHAIARRCFFHMPRPLRQVEVYCEKSTTCKHLLKIL